MIAVARWRKASTRERCIALYPGSNPGRASSLRCSAATARRAIAGEGRLAVARRAKADAAAQLRLGKPAMARGLPRRSPKGEGGLIAPLKAFRSCGIWSKDTRAQG